MFRSQRECVIAALAHERAARWSEASKAWAEAARATAETGPAKRGARPRRASSSATGLAPGTVLQHVVRGVVESECTFMADGDVRYDGVSYGSLGAAANAAAAVLGRKSKTLNGWVYWGLDRQGLSGDWDLTASDDAEDDEEGFDQMAGDADEAEVMQ